MVHLKFPKSARLTRAGEFKRLRQDGNSHHGRWMILGSAVSSIGADSRVGFITSRKVGGAVDRNRVRRRLRELVRVDRPRIKPGFWFVLIGRNRACSATFDELQSEWRALASRAGLFLE